MMYLKTESLKTCLFSDALSCSVEMLVFFFFAEIKAAQFNCNFMHKEE